jgi:hypothetical protein
MPETQPSLLVLILFLVFSLMFFSNSYRLWFKTDQYYQDLYASLTRESSFRPFQKFFLTRLENKQRWIFWQKLFSVVGALAVLAADILMVRAYLQ